jgi:predicted DNA-binding transcriptional regulator YafY
VVVSTRSNRLQKLLEALKAATKDGPATAQGLADDLGVSVRTLYRDLDRLRGLGVPVRGKTGVGLSVDRGAKIPDTVPNGKSSTIEAQVRVSVAGAKLLADDPRLLVDRGRGPERVVRAETRDAIVHAVLRAGGDVVVLGPEKIRREVRARARDVARAHKG